MRKARGHLEWRGLKGRESAGQALRKDGENLAALGEGRRVSEAFTSLPSCSGAFALINILFSFRLVCFVVYPHGSQYRSFWDGNYVNFPHYCICSPGSSVWHRAKMYFKKQKVIDPVNEQNWLLLKATRE